MRRLVASIQNASGDLSLYWGVEYERRSLLRGGMADLWIVSDAVTHADAAVVLGGGLEVRPVAAADLYRRGLINRVLISQVVEDSVFSIGAIPESCTESKSSRCS